LKRFSQHEKKGVTRLHQLRQDDAETFQEVLLFFLQHTSKVDKLLAEFRDNAHFLCEGEKMLTQKRRQLVRFSNVSKQHSLTEMLF